MPDEQEPNGNGNGDDHRNKWGLSRKTNIGLAAITTIGLISTANVSNWHIQVVGIACITALAVFSIGRQYVLDKMKLSS